jgi:hypothetical protein
LRCVLCNRAFNTIPQHGLFKNNLSTADATHLTTLGAMSPATPRHLTLWLRASQSPRAQLSW